MYVWYVVKKRSFVSIVSTFPQLWGRGAALGHDFHGITNHRIAMSSYKTASGYLWSELSVPCQLTDFALSNPAFHVHCDEFLHTKVWCMSQYQCHPSNRVSGVGTTIITICGDNLENSVYRVVPFVVKTGDNCLGSIHFKTFLCKTKLGTEPIFKMNSLSDLITSKFKTWIQKETAASPWNSSSV